MLQFKTMRPIIYALILAMLLPTTTLASVVLPGQILTVGSQGTEVELVQRVLNSLGYSLVEDGHYGAITRWAVLNFQSRHPELTNDGIYGPKTRDFMLAALNGDEQGIEDGTDPPPEPIQDYIQEDLEEDIALTVSVELRGKTLLVPQPYLDAHGHLIELPDGDFEVLRDLTTQLPSELIKDLAYARYPAAYDYFLVTTNVLNVRQWPSTQAQIVERLAYFDKINAVQVVKGEYLDRYGSDEWYRIIWHRGEEIKTGFVFGSLGQLRSFRLERMFEEIKALEHTIAHTKVGYIFNYRHIHGAAPAHQGSNEDAYGVSRNQSAPGYYDLDLTDFRYFADGTLVSILDEEESYYQVSTPSFTGNYWIPKKYVSFTNAPSLLKQVVVIDDVYQNEGVFEWRDEQWHLISYTYATTGIQEGNFHFETPKGHFMAIEKRPFFWYFEAGTSNISGFAPYTIRFSGGGYIHGVPVELQEGQTPYNTSPSDPRNHEEYLFTIGTTPRSRKCVRNFTSHAKFLYDWLRIGQAAVIVIE